MGDWSINIFPEETIDRRTKGNPPINRKTFLRHWLNGTDRLPSEGMPMTPILIPFYGETTVNAVSTEHAKKHRLFQRIFIACPQCGERQPLGRLHQHFRSKRCMAIASDPTGR